MYIKMALTNENSNRTYLSVANGKFTQKVKEDTPGAQIRTKKDGGIIHELRFDTMSGYIKGIDLKVSEYNGAEIKNWNILVEDGAEQYVLSLQHSSRPADGFLRRAENIDYSKPVKFKTYFYDDKTYLALYQNEEKIEFKYTQEAPGELPPMTKVKFKGEERWDDTDKMKYLEEVIEKKVKPMISKATSTVKASLPTTLDEVYAEAVNREEIEDDLPF